MSYLKFSNGLAPSTPATGLVELFVDSADKNLAQIDDTGLIKKFASLASAVLSASNVGTLGTGLFKQKTGTDLEFYKLNSADTKLAIALIGTDRIDFTINANNVVAASTDARLSDARTPLVHATSHKSGGSDVIKLDELGAPTDIATLNASTTAHGLLKKLSNVATEFMNGQGNWATNAFSGGDVSGYIRVQGTGSTPGVGAGLELHYSGGIGVVMSYNSVGPVYTPLIVDALNTKFSISGTARAYLDATRFSLHQAQALGWTATTAEGALDVALYRNSAGNWIEQYNGTNNQSLSLYGTRVGASDYERVTLKHGTTAGITFTSEALGAGMVARDFSFMGGFVGIGTTPPGEILDVQKSTASTATVNGAFRLAAISTGDITDGFGPAIYLGIKDAAGTLNYGVQIAAVRDGADNSQALDVSAMNAGVRNAGQLWLDSSGNVGIGTTGPTNGRLVVAGGHCLLDSAYALCWGSSDVATPDTFLYRFGPNTIVMRNGALGQSWKLMNNYTDASNYEVMSFAWVANAGYLVSDFIGAGMVARDIRIRAAAELTFGSNGTEGQWKLNTSGHFIPGTTDSFDFGGVSNRIRNFFLGKTITAVGTTGAQTINKATGRVNFAAAAQTLVVTNSLVDANSVITATVATDDTTALSCKAIPAAGSFTLKLNAAATAETAVNFRLTN